jgi:hypothetical protein
MLSFYIQIWKKVNQLHLRSPTDSQISDQGAALGTPTASSSGFKSSAKDATSSLKAFAVPRFRRKNVNVEATSMGISPEV